MKVAIFLRGERKNKLPKLYDIIYKMSLLNPLLKPFIRPLLTPLLGDDQSDILMPGDVTDLGLFYQISLTGVIKDLLNNVSQHTDLSVNSRNAIQNTVSNQYLYVDNQINGHPITRSDGASNNYVFDGTFFSNTDFTIFSVQKRTSGGQNIVFGANTRDNIVRWEYGGDTFFRLTSRSRSANGAATVTIPTYNAGNEIFELMTGSFSSTDGISFYRNGVFLETSASATLDNNSNTNARLGKYAGDQDRWFIGDFATLFAYPRILLPTELTGLFNYISNFYGITLG